MPWDSIENVPANVRTHKGVKLTLAQANRWAQIYDGVKAAGGADNPAAVAWSQWDKEYRISDDGTSWVERERKLQEYECECLDCGHIMSSEQHCRELTCPKCGGQMRRVERAGVGYQDFEPPAAGEDAPQEVKDILAKVYESCRLDWVKERPSDRENPANKESCAKIAWSAVEKAGWRKNAEGKWEKQEGLSEQRCDTFDSMLPKLEQLNLADMERTGQTELLMVDGLMIAEGEWKNTVFPADVLKGALDRVGNKRIDVEHEDETWEDVKGFNYKPRWNEDKKGIEVSGAIFDERVIDWHKDNPNTKIGLSVKLSPEATFEQIDGRKTCTYFDIKGIALTLNPACKVCWLDTSEVVQLNSSDSTQSDGGENMADEKPTKEEKPEEEQKQEEEKVEKQPDQKPAEAPKQEAPKGSEPKTQPEDAAPAPPAAAPSTDAPSLTEFNEMKSRLQALEQANKTLHTERSLSETKAMVDGLIESGQLSEANREQATKVLLELSSDDAKAAFLSTIGGKTWKATEKGLVLSEEEKDKDKDKDKEFSEPDRSFIS